MVNNIAETIIETELEVEEKFENYIKKAMDNRASMRKTLIKFLNFKKDVREGGKQNKEILKLENNIDTNIKSILQDMKSYDERISFIVKKQANISSNFCETMNDIIEIMNKEG